MEQRTEKGRKAKLNYIKDYTSENYITFGAKIKKDEYEDLKYLLNMRNLTNAEFIRYCYIKLKSGAI